MQNTSKTTPCKWYFPNSLMQNTSKTRPCKWYFPSSLMQNTSKTTPCKSVCCVCSPNERARLRKASRGAPHLGINPSAVVRLQSTAESLRAPSLSKPLHDHERGVRIISPFLSPSLYLSISLSLYLSISRSLDLSISRSLDLSISRSLYLSISLSLYLSISLSLYLSLYLSSALASLLAS